jgi:ribulose-5-phosphate 4-epimerase/fuculose-1-phosphate aldolase
MSVTAPQKDSDVNAVVWDLRVNLAAAHRLAVVHGFTEAIFNHFTAVTPSRPDRFFTLPFGKHWAEATASELIECGFDGKVYAGNGYLERSAYCIHVPVHAARPDAGAVLHTHMPYASALTRLADSRLLPIGQTEVSFCADIAYDYDYQGFASEPAEGERLARALGDKNILFMGNHGILVLGRSIAEAYDRLYYLERAAQVQLYAMWTGKPLKSVDPVVMQRTQARAGNPTLYGGRPHYELHFDALKRTLAGPPKKHFDE